MSILITGIDMPTKGNPITVLIYPDGTAEWEAQNKAGTAVPVPKHGRLIDADALLSQYKGNVWTAKTDYAEGLRDVANDVQAAPTIIPAEHPKDEPPAGPYDLLYEEGGYNSNGV